ncbi:response regulator transcription factor [Priestia koreensis]|uniref:response regulator transcription factor n=1 Tax=Priestia koreensis TaxID=284581 RepID=UPI0037CB2AA3
MIMVVEDDPKICDLLLSHLQKYGLEASCAISFDNVMHDFHRLQPELVLLDVNLPKFDGYYWCRQIRMVSNCPIMFISARDGKMDQVMALENGADDYITKPFDYDIVLAKIRSHLRRAYGTYASPTGERTVEAHGLTLFPERLELTFGEQRLEVSHTEMKLFEALMDRLELVVSRDRLLEKIWDDQPFVDDNTLNVYMTRVRKKLKELGIDGAIETVRGAGYMMKPTWRSQP